MLAQTLTPQAYSLARHAPRSRDVRCRDVRCDVSGAVSLGAGMVGGAVGVGVAYPLDTLKTKLQAREDSGASSSSSPLALAADIVRDEGFEGFYGGVSSTMAGQAAIKGVVFFVYEACKASLESADLGTTGLLLAAMASGAVGSLVVTPVERVKVKMQASDAGTYASPLACVQSLLETDGVDGFLLRGLGATLLREVPAYAFYFVSYEATRAMLLDGGLLPAPLVPLIGGAVAGAAAWVPVYPIDVVKTNIQVADGGSDDPSEDTFLRTAQHLYDDGGVAAFFDGLGPKLARAVVNHAVTFYVFDLICAMPMFAQ